MYSDIIKQNNNDPYSQNAGKTRTLSPLSYNNNYNIYNNSSPKSNIFTNYKTENNNYNSIINNKPNNFPKSSRNPYLKKLNKYKSKRLEFIPRNIMNLVTVLNSYNLGDKINISSINILTKIKSNYNFNENQNNIYENNNMNQILSPLIIIDRENDKKILRQYYENYYRDKNKDIIEQTAFRGFNGNNNNQEEEKIIFNSQSNPNILKENNNNNNNNYNNNNNNDNLDFSCLNDKENNKGYNDNDRMDLKEYNQSQYNSKKDFKIIQFNNMIMRSNKSSINYKNNKPPYKSGYNNDNYE